MRTAKGWRGKHPFNEILGSLRFIPAHKSILAYQNDLSSLTYMLVLLIDYLLPWDIEIMSRDKQDKSIIYKKILEKNMCFISFLSFSLNVKVKKKRNRAKSRKN